MRWGGGLEIRRRRGEGKGGIKKGESSGVRVNEKE